MAVVVMRERVWGLPYLGFVMPAAIFVGLLYFLPIVWLALFSFQGPAGLTTRWYEQILNGSSIHNMMLTTVRIVGLTTVFSLLIGYVVAYAMVHMTERQRLVLTLCVLVPFWLSVLVRAFAWLILLRDKGLVTPA